MSMRDYLATGCLFRTQCVLGLYGEGVALVSDEAGLKWKSCVQALSVLNLDQSQTQLYGLCCYSPHVAIGAYGAY